MEFLNFNRFKAAANFIKSLSTPNVKYDDLVVGQDYYLVTERLNGFTSLRAGCLIEDQGAELLFKLVDGSISFIRTADYNLSGNKKSSCMIFEDVDEALEYLGHLRDVIQNKRSIQ